jgi:hypothetical protein
MYVQQRYNTKMETRMYKYTRWEQRSDRQIARKYSKMREQDTQGTRKYSKMRARYTGDTRGECTGGEGENIQKGGGATVQRKSNEQWHAKAGCSL